MTIAKAKVIITISFCLEQTTLASNARKGAGQVKRLMSTRFLHISLFPAVTEGNGQNIVPARYGQFPASLSQTPISL